MGVCAYNEEQNIGQLLSVLQHEVLLDEIIVVASGCTDRTVEIAQQFPVKVIVQEKREGKASAINMFIDVAKGDILILESADTIPLPHALEQLIELLDQDDIGAVGGHPKPLNDSQCLTNHIVNLIWDLHHLTALQSPKIGEAIAFKRVFKQIPRYTLTDEACIEAVVRAQGYKVVYAPDAIFINKGPQTMTDLFRQRERIQLGHLYLRKDLGFNVSTANAFDTVKLLIQHGYFIRSPFTVILAVLVEARCRYKAKRAYRQQQKNGTVQTGIWNMVVSSKDLVGSKCHEQVESSKDNS
jgi:cellulose synthase/poly-beta-1,6-N-acetylglucosamine synthase-like glycosyltransferase